MASDPPGTNSLPAGGTIIIGSTPIQGGTSNLILYDNNGVVGETSGLPAGFFGNPTNPGVNATGSNGVAATAMRSDAVLVLDQTVAYAFTGLGATTISAQGASASALTLTGGTITTSQPLINATQTWNLVGTSFTAIKLNVTNSAAATTSALMDLQTGSASKFLVGAKGTLTLGDGSPTNENAAIFLNIGSGANNPMITGYVESGSNIMFLMEVNQAAKLAVTPNGIAVAAGGSFGFQSGSFTTLNVVTQLTSPATATLQLGLANAASPVAQTLQAQGSRAGTDSNVGGASLTIQPGTGTGTGTGSATLFLAPALAASGSGAQTQTEVARVQGQTTPAWKWTANNGTGAGAALLGANSPSAHLSSPYTWVDVIAGDGTLCTMPIWQK